MSAGYLAHGFDDDTAFMVMGVTALGALPMGLTSMPEASERHGAQHPGLTVRRSDAAFLRAGWFIARSVTWMRQPSETYPLHINMQNIHFHGLAVFWKVA